MTEKHSKQKQCCFFTCRMNPVPICPVGCEKWNLALKDSLSFNQNIIFGEKKKIGY